MFQTLSKKLTASIRSLTGRDKLTQQMLDQGAVTIEEALIEADCAESVINDVLTQFKHKALDTTVPTEAKQGDYLIKLFHDELVEVLGKNDPKHLNLNKTPSVIMLAGLQGAGKTTFAAKLAHHLSQKDKKKILLASCDVYRPAAMEQLKILAHQIGCDYFESANKTDPEQIAQEALKEAKTKNYAVLIVDTAGRNHLNHDLMKECVALKDILDPSELLFVIDAMSGQDAAITAEQFNNKLPITGCILTKTDSDMRGGAALSVRHVVNKPIKFMGTGEKIDDLDQFDAERIAGAVLGMGDVVSLIQDIEKKIDKEENAKLFKKMMGSARFDFNDFKTQIEQLNKMGGMESILSKLPMMGGANPAELLKGKLDASQFDRYIHLINSMTLEERSKTMLVMNIASRQKRICKGAGVDAKELKAFLKQFAKMEKMMSKMQGKKFKKMMEMMSNMNK